MITFSLSILIFKTNCNGSTLYKTVVIRCNVLIYSVRFTGRTSVRGPYTPTLYPSSPARRASGYGQLTSRKTTAQGWYTGLNWRVNNPCIGPPEMMFVPITGGKLANVITHYVICANQKTEYWILYCSLCYGSIDIHVMDLLPFML